MFKYQAEIMKEIADALKKMEEMTEEKYAIKIGYELNDKTDVLGRLGIYGFVNHEKYFGDDDYGLRDGYNYYYGENYETWFDRFYINEDVFIKLNNLIDKIITDNKKRDEFHENLLNELKSFNKALRDDK